MKLLLVRHAHAGWSPDENRPLSAAGLQEAQKLADTLSLHAIGAVYSSPLRRALQTVQPVAQRLGLDVVIEPDFRERVLGDFSGLSFEEAVRRTWSDFHFAFPGGESNAAAQDRAVRAVQSLAVRAPAAQVVVGTHGNLLALILNHYDSAIGYDFWRQLKMPDVVELDVSA